jgi:hypothetical protein
VSSPSATWINGSTPTTVTPTARSPSWTSSTASPPGIRLVKLARTVHLVAVEGRWRSLSYPVEAALAS